MDKKKVWVVGHKHPDTDSICAAIAYANYKNALREVENPNETIEYVPKRAGSINAETAYVLERFKVDAPKLVSDVGTQLRDIRMRKTEGVSSHISMKKACFFCRSLTEKISCCFICRINTNKIIVV